MIRRLALLIVIATLGALGLAGTASADPAPVWKLEIHHSQTNFSSAGVAQYWVYLRNVGDAPSNGTATMTINLPEGLSRRSIWASSWSCPGKPGDATITCTNSEVIKPHEGLPSPASGKAGVLVVNVNVESEEGDVITMASVEGGGAANVSSDSELTHLSPEPAKFGIVPDSFQPDFVGSDWTTPIRESGAHPELATFPFDFNLRSAPTPEAPENTNPSGNVRNLEVVLPPGFVGNPSAVGECTPGELLYGECPPSSQVGVVYLTLQPVAIFGHSTFNPNSAPVFNMTHPRGAVTDLAFEIAENAIHIRASLDASNHYAIKTTVPDINETLPAYDQRLVLWGVPAAASHDSERSCPLSVGVERTGCKSELTPKPFLTIPSQCETEHRSALRNYDSWQETGVFGTAIETAVPGETTHCERPRFEPEVQVHPTGSEANAPTGLEVHVKVAQNETPSALATPPVKSVKITLPEGMTVSPSFADGLTGCAEAQIGLGSNDPVACPDPSRIGAVSLSTPLLPRQLEGSMYLARQKANPFSSFLAFYIAVHDTEERGILVKIPGKLELDPVSGQIISTFDELPQFPFDDFNLAFRSGQRAPLVSSPTCGKQTIGVQVSSYARPDELLDVSNSYDVTEGPGGSPCPSSLAARRFAPVMEAGTTNPNAGTYAPFTFQLRRTDQDQELSGVTTTLPQGLLAKIAGVPFCPETAIASISEAEGTAQGELEHPSCPSASRIGTIDVGVGAGTGPNYFRGQVYLAGPYKGAPLSLAVVIPGIAGPVDLGSVVVRTALHVNPENAQVTAVSDSFPTILHGVLLRVRDVRLNVDRPQTTLNPTNCDPMAITGLITGVGGNLFSAADDSSASVSNPFQVANCALLGFKPKLTFKLKGGTSRGDFPALSATLRGRPGDANIARTVVTLPHSEFLEQGHIGTVCTRVQFAASQCPPRSIYGHATATSPLFDETLEGPVYLRSSTHALPDLVVSLNGKIDVALAGRVDSVHGGIRNSFEVIPDAPVSKFTLALQGGKKSLLVNSRNLCGGAPARADVQMTGQNGKLFHSHPEMQTACAKQGRKGKHRAR